MDSLPGGFIDWNTLSLDEMVKYLKEKYMFSSTGDAKCIHHLIEFYEKSSYKIYYEIVAFCYVLLCRFGDEYLMTTEWGYDPKYELKYHYDKFGLAKYYVVE